MRSFPIIAVSNGPWLAPYWANIIQSELVQSRLNAGLILMIGIGPW